jgi:hypothetical protein
MSLFPLVLGAQVKNLKKALKNGHNQNLEYKATFNKKVSIDKKPTIREWCQENAFMVKSFDTYSVDRFGGAIHSFISSVTFISLEDDAYLKAKKRNTHSSYDQFLSSYRNSKHKEAAFMNLVQVINEIPICSKYVKKYPSISRELEDRAIYLANRANTSRQYAIYLRHFPNGIKTSNFSEKVCELSPTVSASAQYAKEFPSLRDCLEDRAINILYQSNKAVDCENYMDLFPNGKKYTEISNRLVRKSQTVKACADYKKKYPFLKDKLADRAYSIVSENPTMTNASNYISYFPYTTNYHNAQLVLVGNITTIQECKRYAELHKDMKPYLQKIAYEIAIRGNYKMRKEFVKEFPNIKETREVMNLLISEEDNLIGFMGYGYAHLCVDGNHCEEYGFLMMLLNEFCDDNFESCFNWNFVELFQGAEITRVKRGVWKLKGLVKNSGIGNWGTSKTYERDFIAKVEMIDPYTYNVEFKKKVEYKLTGESYKSCTRIIEVEW